MLLLQTFYPSYCTCYRIYKYLWQMFMSCYRCRVCTLTGGEIALLASMRVECPEFFYKCLQDMLKIKDLLTMSKVVLALNDLS